MPADDYEQRSELYGFASHEEILEALSKPDTVVLDARTPEEIAVSKKVEHANWKQIDCTPTECPILSDEPEKVVANKNATVVLYCRSGRRAATAKKILLEKGYTGPIYNAGGYDDLAEYLISQG